MKRKIIDWILLLLFMTTTFLAFRNCVPDTKKIKHERTDSIIHANAIKDSMNQCVIDSMKAVINYQCASIDSLKHIKNNVFVKYKTIREISTDTLLVSITDTLIKKEEELIDSLDNVVVNQKIQLNLCEEQNRYKTETINYLYADIKDLQTEISDNKPSWFSKNKGWIGFGIGILTSGIFILSK